jgi:hypothetical protein
MKRYARIQDGVVVEFFSTELDIATLFHPDLVWVDVTSNPAVTYNWSYAGNAFTAPVGGASDAQ